MKICTCKSIMYGKSLLLDIAQFFLTYLNEVRGVVGGWVGVGQGYIYVGVEEKRLDLLPRNLFV